MRRVGKALIDMADALAPLDEFGRGSLPIESALTEEKRLGELAQAIYGARRQRLKWFSKDLFAEPAWDMLLDLFVNTVRKRRTTVTSLCLAAAVPPASSLRWIGILVSEGLVECRPADLDHRATEVRLTRAGFEAVQNCLREIVWL